jgi:soluble lytic murein transglycosylase-like protein
VVQSGETLSEIAEVYGVALQELVAINGLLDEDLIYAGDTLEVPDSPTTGGGVGGSAATGAAQGGAGAYIVQPGDTLEGIALAYGVGVGSLLAANPQVVDPDLLFVGQSLRVPGNDVAIPSNDLAGLLTRAAARYGLDPALVQALAWQESGWRQGAVSGAGAVGVMQLLPETAAWVARAIVGRPLDTDGSAADNVEAGVALLSWLIDEAGSEELALAYYFQGQGSVARYGWRGDTQAYVAGVLALRRYFALYGAPPP